MEAEMVRTYFPGVLERIEGSLQHYGTYAFITGPIQVLAQMGEKGEIESTDEFPEQTFAGVENVPSLT